MMTCLILSAPPITLPVLLRLYFICYTSWHRTTGEQLTCLLAPAHVGHVLHFLGLPALLWPQSTAG
jgi:hypothetical protein